MALARTDLLSVISPAAGGNFGTGTFTSAAFTPPSSSLLTVVVGFAENAGGTNPAADFVITDSGGHTWTQRFLLNTTGGFATALAVFTTPIVTGASMTVSFTCNSRNISWWAPSIFAHTGYNVATPFGATVSQISNNFGAASPTPWSITLSGAPATTSEVIGAVAADRDTAGATQGTGYTEIHDVSNPTATIGGGTETEARTGSTSTTVDWQAIRPLGGNLFNFIVVGFEVQAAAGGGDTVANDPTFVGARLAGSPATAAADVIVTAAAGSDAGARAAGSPATAAADVVVTAGAVGARLGGSPATALADTVAVEPSAPGARLGVSPAGAAADVVVVETAPRGSRLGVSPATGQQATDTVSVAPAGAGARLAGSPAAASTSQVVHDQMVMPLAALALNCLTAEVAKLANPPAKVQMRPGRTFTALADQTQDECCAGIAYVRPSTQIPTTGHWPQPLSDVDGPSASRGNPPYYAAVLELGIWRCIPTVSNVEGEEGMVPTAAQWLQATQDQLDDAAALRRVACCLRLLLENDSVIAGNVEPLENQGPCGGVSMTVTLRAPACDCVT